MMRIIRNRELSLSTSVLALLGVGFLFSVGCSSDPADDVIASGGTPGAGGSPSAAGGSTTAGGSAADGGSTTAGGSPGAGGTVAGQPVVGSFAVILQDEKGDSSAYSTMQGAVRDGALNDIISWELQAEDGECRLLVPAFPFCDPECVGGASCVVGDTCRDAPLPLSAGTVTIDGLDIGTGVSTFSMEPVGRKSAYQPPAVVDLPYPPTTEGAVVSLSAAGEDSGPFSIETAGIAPLDVPLDDVVLATDTPIALSWTPPGANSTSTIEVLVDISHHGGAKGKIICETADTGALTIPADLATQLLNLGVAGFPTVKISRISKGVAEAPNDVSFSIVHHVPRPIVIDGVTSCTLPEDCVDAVAGPNCLANRTCGP